MEWTELSNIDRPTATIGNYILPIFTIKTSLFDTAVLSLFCRWSVVLLLWFYTFVLSYMPLVYRCARHWEGTI